MNRKILSFGLGLFLSANSAYALDYSGKVSSNNKPVLLSAKEVGYDQQGSTAIAIGNVEMVQEDTIILADRVTYNQKTDEVHASGNVSILEPSGDVVFADDVKLQKTLQTGVVAQFKARLKDNSLFAANEAQKIDKNVTILHQAVYSPCKVCQPKEGEAASAPLWQMEASRVKVDDEVKRVRYKNAFMEVYGVPVFYTPYFSHPTPDAPSESGFLVPKYYHSQVLGNVVETPVFVSFASNTDMTLTPWYIGNYSPLLKGEFRHLFEDGSWSLRGAITDTASRDSRGKVIPGSKMTRDYIEGHGKYNISDNWKAGTDFEVTSDDTFLAFYSLGWKDMLTSRAYAERIEDRDYTLIESVAFQGLQPQDIRAKTPYALPQVDVHLESEPLVAHSRIENDSNILALERRLGDSSQRLSNTVAWKLPYVTKNGQILEAKAS
ncbi:MAG: LPS assembly protein LptD, partial [Pseudomonadota bacterium]